MCSTLRAEANDMLAQPLLRIEDLRVSFVTPRGRVEAVRGVSLAMGREKLGIVGESGSGKSQTGRAILGLIRPPGQMAAKTLEFDGVDLQRLSERQMRAIRGQRITMVMQDPKFSLNPVLTIGRQISEAYRTHHQASRNEARDKALQMLEKVRIRDPVRVLRAYPHEVSGGMGQRIMIAMMLVSDPDLLIADEPTSALDVTVRLQVLAILDELVAERGMGLIFISHDLNLVTSFCDRVVVMYSGKVMEDCAASELHRSRHPYTQGLLQCIPALGRQHERLPTLARNPSWL